VTIQEIHEAAECPELVSPVESALVIGEGTGGSALEVYDERGVADEVRVASKMLVPSIQLTAG
jgi:hypothetical protein